MSVMRIAAGVLVGNLLFVVLMISLTIMFSGLIATVFPR